MKLAVIAGDKGQDGQILWNDLVSKNYAVLGLGRDSFRTHAIEWNSPINICDFKQVLDLISRLKPHEIYHLAAKHRSSEGYSKEDLQYFNNACEVNTNSLAYMLESVRVTQSKTKVFYASSSHIFGKPLTSPQDEMTPFLPESVYAITKVTGMNLCKLYRVQHGVFAATGIFYNHESPLRNETFVSKKIITSAVRIKKGLQKSLVLGDLGSQVDWGYAPDYVEAMQRIMQLEESDDFIISTGQLHTVQEFVEIAFSKLGLDWREFVSQDKQIISRNEVPRSGNNSKLRMTTGWSPKLCFKEMIEQLLAAELNK